MLAILFALLAVVNSTSSTVSYACDGVTAVYTVNFPYLAQSDLAVTSTTGGGTVTTLTITTDYTLSVTSTTSTATLTLTNPAGKCPSGNTLKIANNLALTQPQSFRTQGSYFPAIHEQSFDRLEMQIQLLNRSIGAGGSSASSLQPGALLADAPLKGDGSSGNHLGLTTPLAEAYGGTGVAALTCTNTNLFLTSNGTAYLCATASLASPNFQNQGTTTTVLHGNAAGNPSWGSVSLTADVTGTLPEANGGTNAGALTCTNQFLTSNGTSYSCSTATLASAQFANQGTTTTLLHGNAAGNPSWTQVVDADLANAYSGVGSCTNQFVTATTRNAAPTCTTATLASAQFANQGTTSSVLIGNAAGNPSWATSVPAAAENVQTDFTLIGNGSTGAKLGINLTNANTWTATQTFSPTSSGAIVATGNGSSVAITATGGATNASGISTTGGGTTGQGLVSAGASNASGQAGQAATFNAGTSSGNASLGANGISITSSAGTAATSAGPGAAGGYTIALITGNGGAGNGANPGGVGGSGIAGGASTIGNGGTGGATGNGGGGGYIFGTVSGALTGGAGGAGGATSGTGGVGGGSNLAGGTGGPSSTASAAGGGGPFVFTTGAGGANSSTGPGGPGGIITLQCSNGGNSTSGTGGSGGICTLIAGNGGTSNGGGGYWTVTGGNGTGTGINGDGLLVASGSGGTGTTHGVGLGITQNNTIRAHMNWNSLSATPSTLVNGDTWVLNTGAASFQANWRANSTTYQYAGLPLVVATTTTAQSITNSTHVTLKYDTSVTDTDSGWSTTNGQFTVPTGKGGNYQVTCAYALSAGATATDVEIELQFNGTSRYIEETVANPTTSTSIQVTGTWNIAAGQIIQCQAFQNSAGAITLNGSASYNYINIKRLPD